MLEPLLTVTKWGQDFGYHLIKKKKNSKNDKAIDYYPGKNVNVFCLFVFCFKCLLFDYVCEQGVFNEVSNFLGLHLERLIQLELGVSSCSRGHHLKVCILRATEKDNKLYWKLH